MSTGWICPKCGRVYAPFICECTKCNNKVGDTVYVSSVWQPQDYSKCKSEVTADPCKCDQGVTIDDEQLKYTTSREFNSDYLTYTTTTTQNLKLDKEPMLFSQMICDSQGCREVETLMPPEGLKELAERISRDEDVRESSFEVMLEDDVQTEPDKIKEDIKLKHTKHQLSDLPDYVDARDWYLLKVEYDRAGVTQPSEDCEHPKWECPNCKCLFYKFPYKGCYCGTKGEEMLSTAE